MRKKIVSIEEVVSPITLEEIPDTLEEISKLLKENKNFIAVAALKSETNSSLVTTLEAKVEEYRQYCVDWEKTCTVLEQEVSELKSKVLYLGTTPAADSTVKSFVLVRRYVSIIIRVAAILRQPTKNFSLLK